MEDALTTYMLAQTGLTALIDRRFHFDELPPSKFEGSFAAVVCSEVSDNKTTTHDGIEATEEPVYQFTAYATTRAGARDVAEQIKLALTDFKGDMSGVNVQAVTLINELKNTEKTPDGLVKIHTVELEFQIVYDKE